jgi:ribosome-associated protein
MPAPQDVPIRDESIRLGQFLKLANLIDHGSEAKPLLVQGSVLVNDEVETRRGRQLVPGDVVTLGGVSARVARGRTDGQVEDDLPW